MKRYTLYMNDEIITTSDDLGFLIDEYEKLYVDGKDGLIMDNLTDEVVYGR